MNQNQVTLKISADASEARREIAATRAELRGLNDDAQRTRVRIGGAGGGIAGLVRGGSGGQFGDRVNKDASIGSRVAGIVGGSPVSRLSLIAAGIGAAAKVATGHLSTWDKIKLRVGGLASMFGPGGPGVGAVGRMMIGINDWVRGGGNGGEGGGGIGGAIGRLPIVGGLLRGVGAGLRLVGSIAGGMFRAGLEVGGMALKTLAHWGGIAFQRLMSFGKVAAIAGVAGLGMLAKAGLSAASEMETLNAQMLTAMKTPERAAAMMQFARGLEPKIPFELKNIVAGTAKLQLYGLDATKWMPLAADMAGAMRRDIVDAVEAIADALNGETERMREFGITSRDLIAHGAESIAGGQGVTTITPGGRVKAEIALAASMQEKFGGGAAAMMNSMAGRLTNLKTQWFNFRVAIGQALMPTASWLLQGASAMAQWANKAGVGTRIGQWMANAFARLWEFGQKLWSSGTLQRIGVALASIGNSGLQTLRVILGGDIATTAASRMELIGKAADWVAQKFKLLPGTIAWARDWLLYIIDIGKSELPGWVEAFGKGGQGIGKAFLGIVQAADWATVGVAKVWDWLIGHIGESTKDIVGFVHDLLFGAALALDKFGLKGWGDKARAAAAEFTNVSANIDARTAAATARTAKWVGGFEGRKAGYAGFNVNEPFEKWTAQQANWLRGHGFGGAMPTAPGAWGDYVRRSYPGFDFGFDGGFGTMNTAGGATGNYGVTASPMPAIAASYGVGGLRPGDSERRDIYVHLPDNETGRTMAKSPEFRDDVLQVVLDVVGGGGLRTPF